MPTRNIVLTDQQAEFVKRVVSSGRNQNASEVLREGIRLIERQELENAVHLKALRKAAKISIADMEFGCFQSLDAPEPLRRLTSRTGDAVGGPSARPSG